MGIFPLRFAPIGLLKKPWQKFNNPKQRLIVILFILFRALGPWAQAVWGQGRVEGP